MAGELLHDIDIYPPPNPGLTHLLLSSGMKRVCLYYAIQAKGLWQKRVHKVSHELEASASAGTTVINSHWGPRYAGEIVVDSEHFLPHEEGWTDHDGSKHAGAHDFNAVLMSMAGLPAPAAPEVGKAQHALLQTRVDRQKAEPREAVHHEQAAVTRPAPTRPTPRTTTERRAPGNYVVSSGQHSFRVERLRTETPGYGVEHNWWVTPANTDTEQPTFDPFPTKREATQALERHIEALHRKADE